MNPLKIFTNKIKRLLIDGNSLVGLKELALRLESIEGDKYEKTILLLNQYNNLRQSESLGILDDSQIDQKRNRINVSFLHLIESIEEDVKIIKLFSGEIDGKNNLIETINRKRKKISSSKILLPLKTDSFVKIECLEKKFNPTSNIKLTELIIGRSPQCDWIINDSYISRMHAKISVVNDKVIIEDLGSTNGTFVNSKMIDKYIFTESEHFYLDQILFFIEI